MDRTCDTDRQRQHHIINSICEEVCPFPRQFWGQLLQHIRWRRREELVQIPHQCSVRTEKQLHPWVPEASHILFGDLKLRFKTESYLILAMTILTELVNGNTTDTTSLNELFTSNQANIEQSKKSHWLLSRSVGRRVTSQERRRIISTVKLNSRVVAPDRSLTKTGKIARKVQREMSQ